MKDSAVFRSDVSLGCRRTGFGSSPSSGNRLENCGGHRIAGSRCRFFLRHRGLKNPFHKTFFDQVLSEVPPVDFDIRNEAKGISPLDILQNNHLVGVFGFFAKECMKVRLNFLIRLSTSGLKPSNRYGHVFADDGGIISDIADQMEIRKNPEDFRHLGLTKIVGSGGERREIGRF